MAAHKALISSEKSCIGALRNYVDKMLDSVSEMKILLLDAETTGVISMVYTQTEILRRQTFLVEDLRSTAQHGRMMHLRAVVFVRPTAANVEQLTQELADPHYSEYYIFFSGIVNQDMLSRIAKADVHEVIRTVQEFYGDYYAITHDCFTLNIVNSLCLSLPKTRWRTSEDAAFERTWAGVVSILLAMKMKPVVRYQGSSDLARILARKVQKTIMDEGRLFSFRSSSGPPTLLLLDRRDDPVTPLLTQWTYQAMVHEMIGMNDNRVDMSRAPGIRKDLREVVLSPADDSFYAKNMFANFGDLGVAIKDLLARYQREFKDNQNLQSIQDMQNFVERYPEFKAMSTNVSKHVAVVGELSRLVDAHKMMDVSQLEQTIACGDDHGSHLRDLRAKLAEPSLAHVDALRLVLLYALKYQDKSDNQIKQLKASLRERGCPENRVRLIDAILEYGGSQTRGIDLFGNQSFMAQMSRTLSGLKGVENVYTQHSPILVDTVANSVLKGKAKEQHFPFVNQGAVSQRTSKTIVVFVIGGITFEEVAKVAALNSEMTNGARIILGGTFVHNSKSFLGELENLASRSLPSFS